MDFDWDEGNRNKNVRHNVQDWEIEEALEDRYGVVVGRRASSAEVRFIYLGRAPSSGRYLRIVYAKNYLYEALQGWADGDPANKCYRDGSRRKTPLSRPMTRKARKPVHRAKDIPSSFSSEDEERQWWAEHELSGEFFAETEQDLSTHVANLELQLAKLSDRVNSLSGENRLLRDRLHKLEARLPAEG